MTEYYLRLNDDGSLNKGYLSVFEDGKETVLIECIKTATEKGWESSKKIFENLDVIYKETNCDLIITENCAKKLVDKYGSIKTKTWQPYQTTPPSAAHEIAKFITKNGTDPYDRG